MVANNDRGMDCLHQAKKSLSQLEQAIDVFEVVGELTHLQVQSQIGAKCATSGWQG